MTSPVVMIPATSPTIRSLVDWVTVMLPAPPVVISNTVSPLPPVSVMVTLSPVVVATRLPTLTVNPSASALAPPIIPPEARVNVPARLIPKSNPSPASSRSSIVVPAVRFRSSRLPVLNTFSARMNEFAESASALAVNPAKRLIVLLSRKLSQPRASPRHRLLPVENANEKLPPPSVTLVLVNTNPSAISERSPSVPVSFVVMAPPVSRVKVPVPSASKSELILISPALVPLVESTVPSIVRPSSAFNVIRPPSLLMVVKVTTPSPSCVKEIAPAPLVVRLVTSNAVAREL